MGTRVISGVVLFPNVAFKRAHQNKVDIWHNSEEAANSTASHLNTAVYFQRLSVAVLIVSRKQSDVGCVLKK